MRSSKIIALGWVSVALSLAARSVRECEQRRRQQPSARHTSAGPAPARR